MSARPRPAGPTPQPARRSRSTTVTAASAKNTSSGTNSSSLSVGPTEHAPTLPHILAHVRAPSSTRSHQDLRAMNDAAATTAATSSASSPTSPITTSTTSATMNNGSIINPSTSGNNTSRSRAGSSAAARYLSVNTQAAAASSSSLLSSSSFGAVPPLPSGVGVGGEQTSTSAVLGPGAGPIAADAALATPTIANSPAFFPPPTMSSSSTAVVHDAAQVAMSPASTSSVSPHSATQSQSQRPTLSRKSSSKTVASASATMGSGASVRKTSAPTTSSRQASGSGKESSRTRDREKERDRDRDRDKDRDRDRDRERRRAERADRALENGIEDEEAIAARMCRMHLHDAQPAPPTLMYWSRAPVWGALPTHKMRSHSANVVDNTTIWLFGGCDDKEFWRDVLCLDVETMEWTRPETVGDVPPPCRAHTATLVDRRLFIFGGGQANMYYNALYILDTVSRRWTHVPFTNTIPSPSPTATDGTSSSAATTSSQGQGQLEKQDRDAMVEDDMLPRPRRAHTTVLYKNRLVVFGGGNGAMALNDVWVLDVSVPPDRMRWERQRTSGARPTPRGYHTANLVGNVMIVVGGSDGRQTFSDIYCLNLDTWQWSMVPTERSYRRLAHTATQIGSYLFIMGGHDGSAYTNELLFFNLVSLQYEPRPTRGPAPSSRGYHAAALADGRLWIFGGYDARSAHDDVHMLDLASSAYLSQVMGFRVSVE